MGDAIKKKINAYKKDRKEEKKNRPSLRDLEKQEQIKEGKTLRALTDEEVIFNQLFQDFYAKSKDSPQTQQVASLIRWFVCKPRITWNDRKLLRTDKNPNGNFIFHGPLTVKMKVLDGEDHACFQEASFSNIKNINDTFDLLVQRGEYNPKENSFSCYYSYPNDAKQVKIEHSSFGEKFKNDPDAKIPLNIIKGFGSIVHLHTAFFEQPRVREFFLHLQNPYAQTLHLEGQQKMVDALYGYNYKNFTYLLSQVFYLNEYNSKIEEAEKLLRKINRSLGTSFVKKLLDFSKSFEDRIQEQRKKGNWGVNENVTMSNDVPFKDICDILNKYPKHDLYTKKVQFIDEFVWFLKEAERALSTSPTLKDAEEERIEKHDLAT